MRIKKTTVLVSSCHEVLPFLSETKPFTNNKVIKNNLLKFFEGR